MGDRAAPCVQRVSALDTLPTELLTYILAFVEPLLYLQRVASVSRKFYALAWDVGLSYRRTLVLFGPACETKLRVFEHLLQLAIPKNQRIHLTVKHIHIHNYLYDPEQAARDYRRNLPRVVSAITASLPVLVALNLECPHDNFDLTTPLRHRMPRLESLILTGPSIWPSGYARTPLPQENFTGYAPRLRRLELKNVLLSSAPCPAFANVTSLSITEGPEFPAVSCVQHFPKLSHLQLEASAGLKHEPRAGLANDSDEMRFNLEGVALRLLVVGHYLDLPAIERAIDLESIPVVCISPAAAVTWIPEPAPDAAPLSLRLFSNKIPREVDLVLTVVPSHRRWRRYYEIYDWPASTALPLAEIHSCVGKLAYLRLEHTFLHVFLSAGVALPALRRVRVDVLGANLCMPPPFVWPPDAAPAAHPELAAPFLLEDKSARDFQHPSRYSVPCPALDELALCSHGEDLPPMPSSQAAFLGRALGQLARPAGEQAVLTLVGVEFVEPRAEQLLLDQTFSAVRVIPFDVDEWIWKPDDDVGIWDHPDVPRRPQSPW